MPSRLQVKVHINRALRAHTVEQKLDEIAVGHLVIAKATLEYGWWESIVVERTGDMLTLRWVRGEYQRADNQPPRQPLHETRYPEATVLMFNTRSDLRVKLVTLGIAVNAIKGISGSNGAVPPIRTCQREVRAIP